MIYGFITWAIILILLFRKIIRLNKEIKNKTIVIIAKLNKIFEAMPNKIFGKYNFIIKLLLRNYT